VGSTNPAPLDVGALARRLASRPTHESSPAGHTTRSAPLEGYVVRGIDCGGGGEEPIAKFRVDDLHKIVGEFPLSSGCGGWGAFPSKDGMVAGEDGSAGGAAAETPASADAPNASSPRLLSRADALAADPRATLTIFGYVGEDQTMGGCGDDQASCSMIDGLLCLPDFVTASEEAVIMAVVDAHSRSAGPASASLRRRSHYYGYDFHPRNKLTHVLRRLPFPRGAMPTSTAPALHRLVAVLSASPTPLPSPSAPPPVSFFCSPRDANLPFATGLGTAAGSNGPVGQEFNFDQCIVNDYRGGQGIRPHIDRRCFGDCIVGISLGEVPAVMDFKNRKSGEVKALLLERRSILVLRGEARWEWHRQWQRGALHVWRGKVIERTDKR